MSRSAKDYLAKHNIPVLFDQISKELLNKKPDDPIALVLEMLRQRKAQDSTPARRRSVGTKPNKRRPTIPLSAAAINTAPLKLQGDALASLLDSSKAVVIDVRENDNYPGGNISGSIHIPFRDFESKLPTLLSQHRTKSHIVFVCMNAETYSPMAATAFLTALDDPSRNNVYILLGGFAAFVRSYPKYISNYDGQLWGKIWEQMGQTVPHHQSGHARLSPAFDDEDDVPPAPMYGKGLGAQRASFKVKMQGRKPSLNIPQAPIQIDKETLADMLLSGEKVMVVDVREGNDYSGGHILNSTHIPLEQLQRQTSMFTRQLSGKYNMVVCMCLNGESHSSTAGHLLIGKLGTTRVGTLTGGFSDFVREYSSDSRLVTEFDMSMWLNLWEANKAKAPKLGRLQSKNNLKLNLKTDSQNLGVNNLSLDAYFHDFVKTGKAHTTVLVDVRDNDEYKGGHIKGSVHAPHDHFEQQLGQIYSQANGKSDIVFICMNAEHKSPDSAKKFFEYAKKQGGGRSPKCHVLQHGFVGIAREAQSKTNVKELVADFDEKLWAAVAANI